jgi:ADP-heptose:LPS heptosyltransferase
VPSRRWPPERFAALGDALAARWGARIVLTGGVAERALVERVAERMAAPSLALVGRTSLGGLAAVIAQLELFVSNDTGPAHLAAALDKPSVVLFGPGDPRRWGPLDQTRHSVLRRAVPCSPCGCSVCPIDHRCLTGITVEHVLEVANTLLAREVAQCAG